MLKLVPAAPPAVRLPVAPPDPCPHGYAMPGNCVRCTPPPAYAPMRGPKSQ